MELRHLRYFVAAAEAENVSRAALKLHVSQPALSRQIRDLESELGFALFERSARSVHLTEAGRVFLSEAQSVLHRAELAVKVGRTAAAGGGELHIGYAPSPTVRILPPTLRSFQAGFPKVRVRLHDLSTGEMLNGVSEGKLHLAILVRPNRAMLRGLQFEELARDRVVLAAAPGHTLARARAITRARACQEPLVAFSVKDYPEYLERLEALFGTENFRIAEEHDGSASLIAAVEAGVGVAVVPQSLSCSAGPRLRFIPIIPEPDPVIIGAIWSRAGLVPKAEAFLAAARKFGSSSPLEQPLAV